MFQLFNGRKLPIVVVGGCHNSQFNVTILNLLKNPSHALVYATWIPECWSWRFISVPYGGAITVIGNTGLGLGYPGEYATTGLSGWIEPRFFHAIGIQGKITVGEAHCQAITDYIDEFVNINRDYADRKTIEQWVLLGDPSLKIGGY
jgi:hypothetical protein